MNGDLISQDELLELLGDSERDALLEDECEAETIRKCIRLAKGIPAVDAVEVVRCKDCRKMCKDKAFGNLWCNRMNATYKVKPDDFCSYGERKDNS